MTPKKTIAIFGATGAQGGGLARAILHDSNSEFTVRAITRNPDSDKAKDLVKLGAEVVAANIDDLESMKSALQGVHGAYCVTFYWSHFSPEKELAEARNMSDATKAAEVKHVIWSTLEDTRNFIPLDDNRMPTLMGKYKVPHFDAKGKANHFFIDAGVPTTFLLPSSYWENLLYSASAPKRDNKGKLAITFPMGNKRLAGIASEDIGKCAYGIFKKGVSMVGKTIGVAGGALTCKQIADALGKALGEEVLYNDVSPDSFRNMGFPGAEELGNMFQFYRDFEEHCIAVRDVKYSRQLNPSLQSFEQWLDANARRIPRQ